MDQLDGTALEQSGAEIWLRLLDAVLIGILPYLVANALGVPAYFLFDIADRIGPVFLALLLGVGTLTQVAAFVRGFSARLVLGRCRLFGPPRRWHTRRVAVADLECTRPSALGVGLALAVAGVTALAFWDTIADFFQSCLGMPPFALTLQAVMLCLLFCARKEARFLEHDPNTGSIADINAVLQVEWARSLGTGAQFITVLSYGRASDNLYSVVVVCQGRRNPIVLPLKPFGTKENALRVARQSGTLLDLPCYLPPDGNFHYRCRHFDPTPDAAHVVAPVRWPQIPRPSTLPPV